MGAAPSVRRLTAVLAAQAPDVRAPGVRVPDVHLPTVASSRLLVRDALDAVYLGSTLRAWITAGVIFAVTFAALLAVRRLLVRRLGERAPRTETRLDDLALGAVRRTRGAFLLFVALAVAHAALPDLPAKIDHYIDLVARLALYLQMVSWGNGAVAFTLARARQNAHDKAAIASLNIVGVIARAALWLLLFLLTLDAFGVNVTALVTGLGVAGVAVALAVQNILGDLLASLAIALDKPFVVGDFIVVDQYLGTVENIGLKTTRLRSLSGEQIVIANSELLKARIRNYQRQTERRVSFTVAIDPGTSAESMAKVPPIVREIVTAIPQTRFDRSHFSAITDAALVVETVYFVTSADYNLYMDIQQRVNLTLLERLRAEKVQLAFSARETVLLNVGPNGVGTNGVGDAHAAATPRADPRAAG